MPTNLTNASNSTHGGRNWSNQQAAPESVRSTDAVAGAGAAIGAGAESTPLSDAVQAMLVEVNVLEGCIDSLVDKLIGLLPPPEPEHTAAVGSGESNTLRGIPDSVSPTTQRVKEAADYLRRQRERIERLRRHVQV